MTGCRALRTGYRELVYAYPVPIPGQSANAVSTDPVSGLHPLSPLSHQARPTSLAVVERLN